MYPKTNELFVADGYGNRRVIVFDADTGAFKRQWGAFGNAPIDVLPPRAEVAAAAPAPARRRPRRPAPLSIPRAPGSQQFGGPVHAVKVSNDGLVYVADRPNRRVQVFTPDGKYVTQMFINRTGPSPAARRPGIAFSPDAQQQFLYVADYGNSHIVVLDRKSLQILYQFGTRSEKPGDFQGLHHLAVDSKGNLYIGEVAPGARAQRFVFKGLSNTLPPNALTPAQLGTPRAVGTAASCAERAERRPRTFPPPGQARGGYPPWTSTMANPYRDDRRTGRDWATSSRAPRSASSPTARAAPGCTTDPSRRSCTSTRRAPSIARFGNGMFVQAHGFCQDRDGNFWAGDSGPFADNPATKGRGFQLFKFSPDGKVLLSLGKAGVSKAGTDTFIGPTACAIAPNGDIIVADGHWPRPTDAQQDGDRLVRLKTDGTFVAQYGKMGTAPGRVHGTARAGVRLAGTAVRRGSLEQPRADLRSQHAVRRRVAALRPAERHRHPARTTRSSSRTPSQPVHRRPATGAGRRRQRGAQSRAGATASGSAARRTVRSATTSRARGRKVWARTTRATSSPG